MDLNFERGAAKLTTFNNQAVAFVETQQVKDGVVCDIYSFEEDNSKDLGIVTVQTGFKTPLQKVLAGDKTIEGFMSGNGTLTVIKEDKSVQTYNFPNATGLKEVMVKVGEVMQWEGAGNGGLVFYEICYPPYKDGRFENLPNHKLDSSPDIK